MLMLPRNLQSHINVLGVDSYPFEGCGLLLGHADDGVNVVELLFPVPNRWENEAEKPVRFRIDERDMLQAEITAADKGLDIVGIFHSHPNHPPDASARDLAWASWPGYSYLITEIREGRPGLSKSWQLLENRAGFVEEEIQYSNSS
jgi:proteasome lid subunit RPN8/RPN11